MLKRCESDAPPLCVIAGYRRPPPREVLAINIPSLQRSALHLLVSDQTTAHLAIPSKLSHTFQWLVACRDWGAAAEMTSRDAALSARSEAAPAQCSFCPLKVLVYLIP